MVKKKYKNTSNQTIKKGDYVRLDPSARVGILLSNVASAEIIGIADEKIMPRGLGTFTLLGAGGLTQAQILTRQL